MEWRGLVNAVLYTVQFDRALDDETVDRVARLLLENPLLGLTPEQEYAALAEALRSGEPLTGDIPQPHSEEAVRDFLARLLNRLDTLRPWPEPPFRPLPISEWERFGGARPIARVHVWYIQAQERLRNGFDQVDTGRDVLLLRLSSGAEVALVTPWWMGSDDLVLLQNSPDCSPEQVISEFMEATGFGGDEVTPLT
jgi:hypothetical protein